MVNPQGGHSVLGLDIGIGSCGWCLIDTKYQRIIASGVRLWDTPQEPKTKVSTASTRRIARSSRRNTKRTADRKKHCLRLLKQNGLVPSKESAQWLQSRKKDKPVIKLRAAGLDRPLNNREWAQVLYSLCDRRGYIPHGEGGDSDNESKKVLSAIEHNKELLSQAGFRTVGEMMYHSGRSRNTGGDYSLCIDTNALIEEIELLFAAQNRLGNTKASEAFREAFREVFSWQKDVTANDLRIYNQVGHCTYFPEEKRAAKSCLSSELCEAYERVGHTTWIDSKGLEHKLPADIRQKIIRTLFSIEPIKGNKYCKVTYSKVRQWMSLDSDSPFKGIDADKEKTLELYKPKAWRLLRDTLSSEFMHQLAADRELADDFCSAITFASSKKSLTKEMENRGFSEDEIEHASALPYNAKLFSGYGNRSLKALNLLVDAFEEDAEDIVTLSDAEQASGLLQKRNSPEATYTQLPPYTLFDPTCKNPVVLRVMGQVRKVVNAVIREYGMPDEVHIELARELKQSKREKQLVSDRNRITKNRRDGIIAKLREETGDEPRMKLIRKVELFEEQGGRCIYCDGVIEYERLIKEGHYAEIDHALPFSRTCDDSQSNKVLSCKKCNQDKKNRTPYEWFCQDDLNWEEFELRVSRNKKLGQIKRQKLLNTNLEEKQENDFIERNLNDTRYASRAAKDFIERYLRFPDNGKKQHVFAVAGGATALLRQSWGIRKDREEDCLHHAADAAVIAACSPSTVIKIAKASEKKALTKKENRAALFADTQPWEGFAAEVMRQKEGIIPTHMIDHKVSGRAFEDTIYSYKGIREDGQKGQLATKKKGLKVSSNYVRRDDGSAIVVDGLAYINLWLDAEGRKGKGQYLLEPIYYADIPFVDSQGYMHRFLPAQSDKKPRESWDTVPERLLATKPLTIFPHDAILVKGKVRRFKTIGIAACSWSLYDPTGKLSDGEATKGLAFASLTKDDQLELIHEDVLGRCYIDLISNSGSKE
ncbi:type II CRISPR RNA-guided endonuclease Cas9 [Parvibacter caecicola]|nr:type II CRISPR RNA-guided endonuclease Cas9 [Parvibacter caecicola]